MPEFSGIEPYTSWDGAFAPQELDAIVAYGDALRQAEATIIDPAADDHNSGFRSTRISWIEKSQETAWLFQKLVGAVSSINQQAYCYDLSDLESLHTRSILRARAAITVGTSTTAIHRGGASCRWSYSFPHQPIMKVVNCKFSHPIRWTRCPKTGEVLSPFRPTPCIESPPLRPVFASPW